MAETLCGYPDREEALVAYLYEDMDTAARATFDAHLAICAKCRQEIGGLSDARAQLSGWRAPDAAGIDMRPFAAPLNQTPAKVTWRTLPVWMQVAAALLVVGVSAGVANLDVHYDQHGLVIRTGWMKPAAAPASIVQTDPAPWRTDLTALEQQLRAELRQGAAANAATAGPAAAVGIRSLPTDTETLKKVRALVEASEKRQQSELALRATDILNFVKAQRTADLSRIDGVLGAYQDKTNTRLAQQHASIAYLVSATQKQ